MSAAAPQWREDSARVVSQADRGGGHVWLELEVESGFEPPQPGQFVMLNVPESRSSALLPRPMSVAGVTAVAGTLRLGFLYVPIGTGTSALAALNEGDAIEILGPLGRGFPLDTPGTPILIAGGRGVAPMVFAAEALRAQGRACVFLFGARSRPQLVGLEDTTSLIEAAGGQIHACTDDGSAGRRGDVIGLLDGLDDLGARVIHACGPHAMLHAVGDWGSRHGVPTYVAMESYMACGTGVCRGCPLPRSARGREAYGSRVPSLLGNREFAMCCTDGPVFEAGDLDWDRIE